MPNTKCVLQAHLSLPYLYTYTPADLPSLHKHVDFIACLGGDGLILHASMLFKHAVPPIVSFKLGSLGFLTCHDFGDYREHLGNVVAGCEVLTRGKGGMQEAVRVYRGRRVVVGVVGGCAAVWCCVVCAWCPATSLAHTQHAPPGGADWFGPMVP